MPSRAVTAVLRERIARHAFTGDRAGDVLAAVARTTAIQAQDAAAARLGVRSRCPGVTEAEVRRAEDDTRSIVRTWLLRGTVHLVPSADLRWLLRLVGPSVDRALQLRWRQLGLSPDLLAECRAALPEVLAGGPLDRHQIRAALASRGLALDHPDRAVATHVVIHAAAAGLVCRGPDDGRRTTFVLIDDWLPPGPAGPSGDDALAELARRYFAAYSPATTADFATWSGLAGARAVALLGDELTPADVAGRPGWRLGPAPEPVRGVRLLAGFDNYLLGYRDRGEFVPAEHYGTVFQGGVIAPTVLVDGHVAGTWSVQRAARRLAVTPFRALGVGERRAVQREARDVGRFLELDLRVTIG